MGWRADYPEPAGRDRGRNAAGRARTWPNGERAGERDAVYPHTAGIIERVAARFVQYARAEAGPGRLTPWLPVAFGCGIALYFAAAHEPVWWVAAGTASVACLGAWTTRARPGLFTALALLAAVLSGFATATIKARFISHPVLAKPLFGVTVKGWVESREVREKSDRIVLRVSGLEGVGKSVELSRVRVSLRKGTAPDVGTEVSFKARLSPPVEPLRPGGYDFARDLYFQGIGASGFVLGRVTTLTPAAQSSLALRYAAALQAIRDGVDRRIASVVTGDARAIASALLTGRRDAISTPVNDALFISGFGHVLSISGYHMAVVAGLVFFVTRALLALAMLTNSGGAAKKYAAFAALVAATFYLLLSGAEVATLRSYYMTALVLVAVIIDRRALTLRTLAIAAMVVLALAPEALVHPSFQMSFAATLGLVALVEGGMPNMLARADHGPTMRAALWGGREISTLALASLIAGLATTPYAAFHFHRFAPYGVIANLLAMPVVSGLVMPAGLLALVAIPFGLDGLFWRLMEVGILWMVKVSEWVTALPGAIGPVPAFGTGPMLIATLGILTMGLLRTRLRWLGLPVTAAAIVAALNAPLPDVLAAADGKLLAARGHNGHLSVVSDGRRNAFVLREWLAADADRRPTRDASLADGTACDGAACHLRLADGALAALVLEPEALEEDCRHVTLIVTRYAPPAGCNAIVINADELRAGGALALYRHGQSFDRIAARAGEERPWSPYGQTRARSARPLATEGPSSGDAHITPDDIAPSPDD